MQRYILYVDNDDKGRERFQKAVDGVDGVDAKLASSVDEALSLLDESIDIVVSEADLDGEVHELFEAAADREPPIPCLVFSDRDFEELLGEGIILHASGFASKERENAFGNMVEEISETLRARSELKYPVPEDEEARIKAVDDLHIDRLRDERAFDRLTKIARQFFDVRYAFVGIIEQEEETFISFEGSDVENLPRECSICTFGILSDDTTVIDDRREDERFKYIDELDELDIVFYAGHPLRTETGDRIGMFCIMDDEERDFSTEDSSNLKLFAEEASELIRLYEGQL